MKKSKTIFKVIMLGWTAFIGVGALYGGISMLNDPTGSLLQMQSMLPYFQILPFSRYLFNDYTFSGMMLILVNGLTNLAAFVLILNNKKAGQLLGCLFGFTLMLWVCIQFVIFPFNLLSFSFFFFGLGQFLCGLYYYVICRQSEFSFDPNHYPNIKNDADTLVVYFSREGYSKKQAYIEADKREAALFELKVAERTEGYPGFWWCGRYGMHGWAMPVEAMPKMLQSYQKVVLVSPIWVFGLSAPMRSFCTKAAGQIKSAEYITLHFRKNSVFSKAFDEMDALLGITAERRISICCKYGQEVARIEKNCLKGRFSKDEFSREKKDAVIK